jgi:hypothetical protein
MIVRPRLPSVPLGDYSSARWATLRRDVDDFLASSWSAEATRHGWEDLDLFGVHATRPSVRPDQAGLVVLLDGCKLVELSANGAVLETPGGTRQSYRRKPEQPGRVLVWEIGS